MERLSANGQRTQAEAGSFYKTLAATHNSFEVSGPSKITWESGYQVTRLSWKDSVELRCAGGPENDRDHHPGVCS